MKSVVRGISLKMTYGVCQQLDKDIQVPKNELRDIEKALPSQPERLMEWNNACRSLLDAWSRLEKHLYMAYYQRLQAKGDKTGAKLGRLIKRKNSHAPILMMTADSGQLVYMQKAISDVFWTYPSLYYTSPLLLGVDVIVDYLFRVPPPTIFPNTRE
ncbi:hypothetical protein NDU88_003799 [Pleurodeles waltl]|uniref:Uncharacterized protein n=1 Tax=Pleurodeles waltl TaxID=8319 RepID=A0AAV7PAM4_PLEWA|nr:hypothetical protein NDU88_003799 [Pleurodeles waltl]